MDIEVSGATPVDDDPPVERRHWYRRRDARAVVLAAVLGIAAGFAVATVRDDHQAASVARAAAVRASLAAATPAPSPPAAPETALPGPLTDKMVEQVTTYNKTEAATVEVRDVIVMTVLRNNLDRLDTARTYLAGDYRLQLICLGDGEIWALFRIGDDEAHVDMDCHSDHVLVSQLLLTARAGGQRAVTLVSDASAGLAVGYQILRSPAP